MPALKIWWAYEMGRALGARGNTNVVIDVDEHTKKGSALKKLINF